MKDNAESRSRLIQALYQRLRETMGVRQSLRETARQTGLPYEEVCRILGFSSDWLQPGKDTP